jgi:hypothetical protein
MAVLRLYRTYRYIDKDPVIDKVRTVIQDEGLFKNLRLVHELSGVSRTTLDNWFHGDTKRPTNPTIEAVLTSLGYERQITKVETLDYEKERVKALRWREKQDEQRDARPRRVNGGSRRSKR